MKALLRPVFVGAISIAIAATSLVGSSSVALAANLVVTWTFGQVYVGTPTYMTTPGPIDKGSPVYLTAKFTGGANHGPYTLNVDWGDGTSELYSFAGDADPCGDPAVSDPSVCLTVQKSDPYANVGSFNVVVFLEDPVATRFNNLPLSVVNSPPSFTSFALSATEIEAGQAVTATGHFTDKTTNDTHTVKLDWNDGSPLTTSVLVSGARDFTTVAHRYEAIGNYTVSVIVTDGTGLWTPETATLSVHEPTPNQAPTMAFEFTAGPEGGDSTLAVTFADPDARDTHTVSVAWGDGQTTNSGTLAATEVTFDAPHVYADIRNYSLVLTLKDSAAPAHSVTEPRLVSPTNVAPEMGTLSLSPSPVVDHQELTLTGSFTDPTGPGTTETFTYKVAWGDGTSSPEVSLGTDKFFSAKHVYDSAGPVTITATVTDANGGNDSSTANLVVGSSNHAPTDLAFAVTATGANVVVTGSFTDPDATDTHTVALSWGDGVIQEVAADGTTFTAPHTYAASNTYTVTATVTDHPAGTSTLPLSKTVLVTIPPTSSAADVLDEISALVRNFNLDRNTERWLLKKIDDLKASLAYGNGQVCSASGTLDHILAFADRTIGNDQFAEFRALTAKLEAAAGCSSNGAQSPKVQKAATVTAKTVTPTTASPTTSAPTPKKDTTAKSAKADTKATAGRNAH